MKIYYITEEQLSDLQVLTWGARFTKAEEVEKFNDLIAQVKRNQQMQAAADHKIFVIKP